MTVDELPAPAGRAVPSRGPYAKTAAVRRRILDACMSEFAETGYYATTLKDIAERAGISQRGLVHHFPSKQYLLEAVLELREVRDSVRVPRLPRGTDSLVAMLEVMADNRSQRGLIQLYSVLRAEATAGGHPAHDHHREQYDDLRVYLTLVFGAIREQGGISSGASPELLATTFLALADGVQLQWLYDPSSIDSDTVLRAFLASHIPAFLEAGIGRSHDGPR